MPATGIPVASTASTAKSAHKINPHLAAGQGNLTDVKAYLKAGGLIDKRDEDRWTPLMMAVREGHLEVAKVLLRTGANFEARDLDKWTALHVAAANGHPDCCQLLLDRGANPRVCDENKRTPLHWAARYGYAAVVELLLKRGADANVVDSEEKYPADVVGQELGEDTRHIVHDLLKQHAEVMKTDTAKRRGSCTIISPAVRISAQEMSSFIPPATEVLDPTSNPVQTSLPQLAVMSGTVTTTDANGAKPGDRELEGPGVGLGNVLTECSTGSAADARPTRAPHRRGSYSSAAHIRDHIPPMASNLSPPDATSSQAQATARATVCLPTNPMRGQAPRESLSTSASITVPTQGEEIRHEVGGGGGSGKSSRQGLEQPEGLESEVVVLRHALAKAEERARVADESRLKAESAQRDVEVRLRMLEGRAFELEKLLSKQTEEEESNS